ncbi:MAG TPA: hypothetical protein VHL58_11910 [Thermoanaerobaculia bacterium]|nr:hypothetical protein [Thermoanaerobaculia bacterium]
MRRFKKSESGEGKGGCIFGLILLVAAIFIAYKLIPVKVRASELRQTTEDAAKSAGSMNESQIRNMIIHKGRELELPVDEEQVKVNKTSERVVIDVSYTVPVQFPGYLYLWHFSHHADNPVF